MTDNLTPARQRALEVLANRGPARIGMGMYDDGGDPVVTPASGAWCVESGYAKARRDGRLAITKTGRKRLADAGVAVRPTGQSLIPEIDAHRPEPLGDCTPEEARVLTERIRTVADQLWPLLAQAHDRKAWAALGYRSFRTYVETEFGMSKQRAYQLLDQGQVTTAIADAAGMESTAVDLPEWQARELKPHLDEVVANVRDAVEDTDPEDRPAAAKAAVEETRRAIRERAVSKPDLDGNGLSHPARFSAALIPVFVDLLDRYTLGKEVLDPFAGAGGIHVLAEHGYDTFGIELEPEWAALHDRTAVGDARDLDMVDASVDAIVTSPCYGNRLADGHDPRDVSLRRSYKFDLGRDLTEGNAGALQWGEDYRDLHTQAWREALRVLRPGGLFVLDISDHVRNHQRQPVAGWHAAVLCGMGLRLIDIVPVATARLRQGDNAAVRVDAELVFAFRKDPVS